MSNEIELVIVPQSDIDRLEKARLHLFEILKGDDHLIHKVLLEDIGGAMWQITHRKYKKVINE